MKRFLLPLGLLAMALVVLRFGGLQTLALVVLAYLLRYSWRNFKNSNSQQAALEKLKAALFSSLGYIFRFAKSPNELCRFFQQECQRLSPGHNFKNSYSYFLEGSQVKLSLADIQHKYLESLKQHPQRDLLITSYLQLLSHLAQNNAEYATAEQAETKSLFLQWQQLLGQLGNCNIDAMAIFANKQQNNAKETDLARARNILGVSLGASQKQIKQAYLKKMRNHHPDLHQDTHNKKDQEAEAKKLNWAYEILKTHTQN